MSSLLRDARGRIMKGSPPPPTAFKKGQSGNDQGMRHAVNCAKLIEQHKCDENMALIASGKVKKAPHTVQVNAYAELCAQAYGRPGTVQIANINRNEVIVKRVIGIKDELL
jgi:hypothetical protein